MWWVNNDSIRQLASNTKSIFWKKKEKTGFLSIKSTNGVSIQFFPLSSFSLVEQHNFSSFLKYHCHQKNSPVLIILPPFLPLRHWYLPRLLDLQRPPLSLVQRCLLGAAHTRGSPLPRLRAVAQHLLRPTSGHGPLPRPAPRQCLPQSPGRPGQPWLICS